MKELVLLSAQVQHLHLHRYPQVGLATKVVDRIFQELLFFLYGFMALSSKRVPTE